LISRVARPSPTDEAPGIATLRAAASDRLDGQYDVELFSVTRRFGAVTAVDDLTLHIEAGSFFSLLGPSGCGKTTTLRLIAGFEQPDHGEIRIAGLAVAGVPAHRRNVNTVFQNYALFPHLDVATNVGYGLKQKGVERVERDRRVGEALELVRLAGYGRRRTWQLSGGQQQRVALARALVNKPNVLLLDEPLGALDLKLRKAMQVELKSLQSQTGITFVYVTHDQEEALTMSDRLAVMRNGRIRQVGTPRELYDTPVERYVADFVGSSNFFAARVLEAGDPLLVEMPSGHRMRATRPALARRLAVGDEVTVAVRPERVRLAPEGSAGIPGRLVGASYLGDATDLLVRTDALGDVLGRWLNSGPATEAARFAVGDPVTVTWDDAAALALAE
jgi:spermidine/putrescine transport system ATP-binding protein